MIQYALYPASVFVPFQESQKTDKDNPRWFMIDLTFKSRANHLVPLTLFKQIAESPPDQVPEDISYIGDQGCKAIREMDLVTRGRLSVQRVSEAAWAAIGLLAEKGGWDEASLKKRVTKAKSARRNSAKKQEPEEPSGTKGEGSLSKAKTQKPTKKRKRKATSDEDEDEDDKEEEGRQRKSSRS